VAITNKPEARIIKINISSNTKLEKLPKTPALITSTRYVNGLR
jgi:hypothetical protein